MRTLRRRVDATAIAANAGRDGDVEVLDLGDTIIDGDTIRSHLTAATSVPLEVIGGRIEGDVVMPHVDISRAVTLRDCTIVGELDVREVHLRSLRLSGCSIRRLTARGVRVEHTLSIEDCHVVEYISLVEGDVGNRLSFNRTTIENATRRANALNLYRVHVGGGTYAEHGFRCYGTVRAIDAHIEGILSFAGARILLPDAEMSAILLDRCVAPSVLLRNGFNAGGRVSLIGAEIGGTLSLTRARIASYGSESALSMDAAVIQRRLIVREATVRGEVFMRGARIGALVDDATSWRHATRLEMEGAEIGRFGGKLDDASLEDKIGGGHPQLTPAERTIVMCRRNREYSPLPYSTLRAAYRSGGQETEARDLTYQQAVDRWRRGPGTAAGRWAVRRTYGTFLGYGCRPGRAAFCLVAVIILLAVITASHRDAVVSTDDSGPVTPICGEGTLCAAIPLFAIDTVLPLVDLGAQDDWVAQGPTRAADRQRLAEAAAIALGWILSGGVALGLRRLWRTD